MFILLLLLVSVCAASPTMEPYPDVKSTESTLPIPETTLTQEEGPNTLPPTADSTSSPPGLQSTSTGTITGNYTITGTTSNFTGSTETGTFSSSSGSGNIFTTVKLVMGLIIWAHMISYPKI